MTYGNGGFGDRPCWKLGSWASGPGRTAVRAAKRQLYSTVQRTSWLLAWASSGGRPGVTLQSLLPFLPHPSLLTPFEDDIAVFVDLRDAKSEKNLTDKVSDHTG